VDGTAVRPISPYSLTAELARRIGQLHAGGGGELRALLPTTATTARQCGVGRASA
jgi:hypothetical protein